jgi:hypothetical protein
MVGMVTGGMPIKFGTMTYNDGFDVYIGGYE